MTTQFSPGGLVMVVGFNRCDILLGHSGVVTIGNRIHTTWHYSNPEHVSTSELVEIEIDVEWRPKQNHWNVEPQHLLKISPPDSMCEEETEQEMMT